MKTFPKLSQSEVSLGIGGGRTINVQMLPVSAIGDLKAISADLGKCQSIDDFNRIHDRMVALAKTVLPDELSAQLERFQIPQLSELLGYLAYGDPDNDDQPVDGDPAKKN